MNRQELKAPKSVLDFLKEAGTVSQQTTLDEAVETMTDELNCEDCIAQNECADRYGQNTIDKDNPRCREVIRAYLSQDYIKKTKEE